MKKLLSLFLSLLFVITPSFSISALVERTSPPTVRYLDVERQQQLRTRWCWAACSSMISDYFFSVSRTQEDIVEHVKGDPETNEDATVSELSQALDFALFGIYDISTTFRATYDFVIDKIVDGKPLIFWINWNTGGAHAVVASGCNSMTTSLRIIDPWYGCATSQYSYPAMVNGTAFESGTGKLTYIFYY